MSTAVLVVWALVLVLLLYLVCVVRYYYRLPDGPLTIVQCDPTSFTSDLLAERMPVVCRGVGTVGVFTGVGVRPRTLPDDASAALYAGLRVPGRYCRTEPVVVRATPERTPVQMRSDTTLLVQAAGTRQVALWSPSHDAKGTLARVDVVLSPGDGLFVPFQWWMADVDGAANATDAAQVWYVLRWTNVLAAAAGTQTWFGASESKPVFFSVKQSAS